MIISLEEVLFSETVSKNLASKAKLTSRNFSWSKCANETLKIYKETSNHGLVTTLVKGTTIRITPPLIIKSEELKKGIKIISECLDKI